MRRTSTHLFVALVVTGSVGAPAAAQTPYPLGPTTVQNLSGGLAVQLRSYTPAVPVSPVPVPQASFATPEDSFVAHVSAMMAGDHAAWLNGWAAEDQARHREADIQQGRTPALWAQIWHRVLEGQTPVLFKRLDIRGYPVLAYRLVDATGRTTFRGWFACKREGSRWVATNDLADDATLHEFFEQLLAAEGGAHR